jgi:fatty-acyl-CoA synthase
VQTQNPHSTSQFASPDHGATRVTRASERAPDYVRLHAKARPPALACIDLTTGQRWSYARLDVEVNRYAGALRNRFKVGRGDRVGVLALNSGAQLLTHLACSRIGAIFVPLNWRLAASELQAMVADAEPNVVLYDERNATLCSAMAGSAPTAPLATLEAEGDSSEARSEQSVEFDCPTVMLFTSGTSGRPKGALVTERNAFQTGMNFSMLGGVTSSSAALCDAPMFHVICLLATIRSVLIQGATVVLSPGFDAELTLRRLGDPDLRITHYFCVPQMAERLRASAAYDPKRLQGLVAIFTGGAPNPPANIRGWLADGILMVNGYGMTEAGTLLGMPLDRIVIEAKIGAAGLAPPTLEMRIVRDDGVDAGEGGVGEIWVRGPNVTPGYWRRPRETAEAFAENGWFRTGDLATRDADGFVTIVGRRKEMYISGGENIYPAEVEACLAEHPAIREVAVIGVPDTVWGEVGVAFVVLAPDAFLDADQLRDHCARYIARYKIPARFEFRDSLPRTSTGKVHKSALKEQSSA